MQLMVKMHQKHKSALILCILLLNCAYVFAEVANTFFGHDTESCSGDSCTEQNQEKLKNENAQNNINDVNEELNIQKISSSDDIREINVIITFTNAQQNINLQNKFEVTVASILRHTSVPLAIHIIGDERSQEIAAKTIKNNAGEAKYRMVNLDVDQLARDLDDIVKPMQAHFSYKPGAYYNHALFFLSIAIHRVMPAAMHRVIMLDADLKFTDDIKKLHQHFDEFSEQNVIGIGREMQPVYRHAFSQYRSGNPGTRVGEPKPDGLPGFNSGVLLLDLDAMRASELYNSLLTEENVGLLTKEFLFKGHLGDQDLFTLINMKYESLFYVLPCEWNRQLCTWWRDHGYRDVFDLYHTCDAEIKIWHGNCNTPIP